MEGSTSTRVPAKKTTTTSEQGTTSTLARWEPYDLLNSFQDEMEQFFQPFGLARPLLREPLRGIPWPRTDIVE